MANEYVEKILKEISSPGYAKWLYDYISRLPYKEFDDESVLEEKQTEDIKNAALLSYFLMHVQKLAQEQNVPNMPDKENEFEEFNYDIKILDKYFNIYNMTDRGTITFISEIDTPTKPHVTVL